MFRSLLAWIRHKLGFDDYLDAYYEAVAENCPEFWDDSLI